METFELTGPLLLAAVGLGVLLVLASAMALGRKLADLEYQHAAGLNGVRQIQCWVNIRTHALRVMLGLALLTVTIGTLAGLEPERQGRLELGLLLVVLAAYAASSLLDWRSERAQVALLIAERTPAIREAPP
jgi:hypothetical protein